MSFSIKPVHNEFSLIPSDIVRQRVVDSRENKIQSINKELAVKEKLLDNSNRLIDRYKEYLSSSEKLIASNNKLIASNNKLIALHQEQRQLIIESKELGQKIIDNNKKMISNNEKIIDAAETLLARRRARSTSAEPIRNPKLEVSELKPFLAKGKILQAQSAKIEDTIKKQDIAIDFKSREIAKLESNVEKLKNPTLASSSVSVSSPKKEGLSTSYTPPVSYTSRFNESSTPTRHELGDFAKFTLEQQRYIAQSQANIFDSFATANLRKLV